MALTLNGALKAIGSVGFIALLTFGYQAWKTSIAEAAENGRVNALLSSTTKSLEEEKVKNALLLEQKDRAERDSADVRGQLMTAQAEALYSRKRLTDAESTVMTLRSQVSQLGAALAKRDPCSLERNEIAEIEEKLAVSSAWTHALKDEQRKEALTARDKKYEALHICLGAHKA